MLHLIERLIPAPIHRALLPIAHRVRHTWRKVSKAPIAGVSVIVTNPAGKVLLLKHSYGPDVWALPGGGLKRGEDPEDCARREVLEEVGIALEELRRSGALEEVLSGSPHTAHLFEATSDAEPKPDQREVIEARFFAVEALPEPLGQTARLRIDHWTAESGRG